MGTVESVNAGAPREIARITVAHELIHALQDQYLNLDSLQRATGDADRTLAAQEQLVVVTMHADEPATPRRIRER